MSGFLLHQDAKNQSTNTIEILFKSTVLNKFVQQKEHFCVYMLSVNKLQVLELAVIMSDFLADDRIQGFLGFYNLLHIQSHGMVPTLKFVLPHEGSFQKLGNK